jgi:hypothetical protein
MFSLAIPRFDPGPAIIASTGFLIGVLMIWLY